MEEYYSVKRAAEALGVSREAVTLMIQSNDIHGRKMNPKLARSKYLIPKAEIERKKKEWTE